MIIIIIPETTKVPLEDNTLNVLSGILTSNYKCLQFVNLALLLCSFLSWVLTGETMRQMVICWLRLMYWPMTVLPGEVYGFLMFALGSHKYYL